MVVSTVLVFTGLIHAAQPYYFIHTLASYRLLPADASGLLGLWLPYLQIVLGLCIGLRIAEKFALYVAACLFTIFAFAQTTVLIRGIGIDCGCFGFVAHTVSMGSVTLPILLIGACTLAIVGGERFSPSVRHNEGTSAY